MPDTPPPELPAEPVPSAGRGGVATRVASQVSSQGFGVDPDEPGVRYAGLRLFGLLAALGWLGWANPWMLVVVLALMVMIFLHELGHYVMAKRAGMKVTEFFLGFGPRIWSTRRGETEYGIKLIPAGAYVKIPGMVNLDEVAPEDEPRTYRQKGYRARLGVAVAGSTMHFLLAIGLIYVALVVVGEPGGAIITDTRERPAIVEEVIPGSGAEAAGLRVGDEIIEIDGVAVPTVVDLTATVSARRGSTVPVTVERDGVQQTVDVDLQEYRFQSDDGSVSRGCGLGISMAPAEIEKVGPVAGLVAAPRQFVEIVRLSVGGLVSFFSPSGISDFARQVGSADEDRATRTADRESVADPCTPVSVPGGSAGGSTEGENRLLSIYGLVRIGSDVGDVDPAGLIGLFALINIFIGVFNLTPLLPFDGGHVAIATYEKAQERRLGRRRYFADVSRLLPMTYVVVLLLGMLFFSSLYIDVVNPIGG
jgi:membrane-associated protease RseP (regulator of RpoE activity)